MGNERLTDPKHPAQKPVSILKKMIQIASNPGDIIFDPFMGVGSTGVAALEMDRRFIGVELEEDYFKAAEKRLDNVMKEHDSILGELFESSARPVVEQTLFDSEDFTDEETPKEVKTATVPDDSLAPIIKWAGGKEKELKYIIPNAPEYKNFYEPFVGGGSVFAAVRAEHYYINDFSAELISLYRNIAGGNKRFYKFADLIDRSWENAHTFFLKKHVSQGFVPVI